MSETPMTEAPMSETPPDAPGEAGPLSHPTARTHYLRARGLLLAPTPEWGVIADEKPSIQQLFLYWVLPLSAFFFLAPQLGSIAFPQEINGVAAAPSVVRALYTVLVGTAFMCGGVWLLAWAIDYFAVTFGGRRDAAQAMKLAVYSGTGLWLSGVFGLAPPLVLASAVGVVSFYTLYRGLPVMMGAPEDKTLPYAASVIATAAVIGVVLMTLSSCMSIVGGGSALSERRTAPSAPVAAAAPQKVTPADPATALDPDKLRRLIPDAIPGGWVRAEITRNAGGVMGFTGPTVEGVFENGGQRIRIQVIDLGQGRAPAAIQSLRVTRPAREDEKGSIRHSDGERYSYEEIDRLTGATRWLTVVDNRVAVAAEGAGGVTMEDLKTAVGLIDMVRVEQIAKGL